MDPKYVRDWTTVAQYLVSHRGFVDPLVATSIKKTAGIVETLSTPTSDEAAKQLQTGALSKDPSTSTSDEKKQSAIAVVQNILVEANCSTEKSTTIVHSRDKKIIGLVVPSSRGSHSATLGGGANESGGNIFTFDSPSQLSIETFSSVALPVPAPLANPTSPCAQECFIICVPKALPQTILDDVFSRFGDLINVYLLPNTNCGYAQYASESSAMKAIEVLHLAKIHGVELEVKKAE